MVIGHDKNYVGPACKILRLIGGAGNEQDTQKGYIPNVFKLHVLIKVFNRRSSYPEYILSVI